VISDVINLFPKHATGWELAYFFSTPNPNIGRRKPLELLKTDPSRVMSLAQAFAHLPMSSNCPIAPALASSLAVQLTELPKGTVVFRFHRDI
jgi:hypothetical protein